MTTHNKQKLEAEKSALTEELAKLGNRDPKSHDWEASPDTSDLLSADPNTSADRFEDFEEKSALIVPLEARLAQVENALAKIAAGTYGKCRVCGEAIEEARLEANPAAETCMKHIEE